MKTKKSLPSIRKLYEWRSYYFGFKVYRRATFPLRMLPDFLVIGAQKGGTTSFYNYLIEHPGILPAYDKEAHFFDQEFAKGRAWYRANFPMYAEKYYVERIQKRLCLTGEATPYYLFHPHAPQRIAKMLPKAKFIALLRNPIDRAYSQYAHQVRQGYETLSFEDAVTQEEQRTAREQEMLERDERYFSFNDKHYTYLARGKYIDQLQRWMELFPREQFLILRSEDFYNEPASSLTETFKFLGLPVAGLQKDYQPYNYGTYSKMEPATRKRLIAYFAPYNARLSEYLGMDFDWDK
jgi:hypothetical protein